MIKKIIPIILMIISIVIFSGCNRNSTLNIKNSIVKIYKDNKDLGSGFIVGKGKYVLVDFSLIKNKKKSESFNIIILKNATFIERLLHKRKNKFYSIKAKLYFKSKDNKIAILKLDEKLKKKGIRKIIDLSTFEELSKVKLIKFDLIEEEVESKNNFLIKIDKRIAYKINEFEVVIAGKESLNVEDVENEFIKINKSISEENSLCPLVDDKGRLIGISIYNADIVSTDDIGYAIDFINYYKELKSIGVKLKLIKNGFMLKLIDFIFEFVVIIVIFIIGIVLMLKSFMGSSVPLEEKEEEELVEEIIKLAYLVCIEGEHAGVKTIISNLPICIGRDPKLSQIIINDEEISRMHCNVYFDEEIGKIIIKDLESSNGTFFINGDRIEAEKPTILLANDRFYLSNKENIFEIEVEDVKNGKK